MRENSEGMFVSTLELAINYTRRDYSITLSFTSYLVIFVEATLPSEL